ncbi:hypothetical protein ACFWD7_06235 [Streptomyces mirabilis]|uniref:hypothetical protein n=1 Tax=Streptomyces mirabilis TaxID=68239 RepID=UPI00367DD5B2
MAMQIVPAPVRADHHRTTAPLPPAALYAMARIEQALAAPDRDLVAKVGQALGFSRGWKPNAHLGETVTRITVWSQIELNTVFERVGGTVTTRQVERSTSDGSATWTATEITLTVQVPDVGPVEVVTDIEDDPEHGYRTDVPVVALARYQSAAVHYRALAANGDYEGCEYVRDEMALCRCQLADAGRLDLTEAA